MKILITGGAGFIGCNAVQHFAAQGHDVYVIDNLSRETSRVNIAWMQAKKIPMHFTNLDITHQKKLEDYFFQHTFDVVLHLAAQVAVTLSVKDPRTDLLINGIGTFNVLECVRNYCPEAIFINASTNKVYGKIAEDFLQETDDSYQHHDKSWKGFSEQQPLSFYSPYGCSKGVADQYTIDYGNIYNLRTVTVRQSCIYGPHQLGIEDQGWIAWFIISTLSGNQISIYGDGKQVRDVLYVSDLIDFYELLINNINLVQGKAFNMGGGKKNSLSLRQFFKVLAEITGKDIDYTFKEWRPGDQKIFISDNSLAEELLGFKPNVSYHDGIEKIYYWLDDYLKKAPKNIRNLNA